MYVNNPNRYRQPEIMSGAYGDVNGDGVTDFVYLTAVKSADPSSPYVEQITLNIQDGVTKKVYTIPLNENGNSGYQPTVFLGDFTKDGIMDILITIDSGGSGAFTFNYIYSFVNNHARKLFDFDQYNKIHQYSVTYMDQYKISVQSLSSNESYLIAIAGRGADYLSQIYNKNGTLKKPITGMVDGVSGFYPVDMDRDGVYEIQAYQKVSGLYHADSFGYVINTLQWDGKKFAIWQNWLGVFGNN